MSTPATTENRSMSADEVFSRQTVSLSPVLLDRYRRQPAAYRAAIGSLACAAPYRDYQPESVAVDKWKLPPSGNVHDYYSQAAYWFPDPQSPTGLPYLRRDGVINPEALPPSCDNEKKNRMIAAIYGLAGLYLLQQDQAAGERAAMLLRHFFLDPATAMNPNLEYGQAIPGITPGRDAGIIETHFFIRVVDAIAMLHGLPSWTAADTIAMQRWLGAYLDWLRDSRVGRDESRAPNNHGTWYFALSLKLAQFCGRHDLAREYLQVLRARLALQIRPDGTIPEELARTQPYSYSIFCIGGFLAAAVIAADCYGDDLFHYRTAGGVGICTALDFLVSFATGEKPWPYPEIKGFVPAKLVPMLTVAASRYGDPHYARVLRQLPPCTEVVCRVFFPVPAT